MQRIDGGLFGKHIGGIGAMGPLDHGLTGKGLPRKAGGTVTGRNEGDKSHVNFRHSFRD